MNENINRQVINSKQAVHNTSRFYWFCKKPITQVISPLTKTDKTVILSQYYTECKTQSVPSTNQMKDILILFMHWLQSPHSYLRDKHCSCYQKYILCIKWYLSTISCIHNRHKKSNIQFLCTQFTVWEH